MITATLVINDTPENEVISIYAPGQHRQITLTKMVCTKKYKIRSRKPASGVMYHNESSHVSRAWHPDYSLAVFCKGPKHTHDALP